MLERLAEIPAVDHYYIIIIIVHVQPWLTSYGIYLHYYLLTNLTSCLHSQSNGKD